MLKYFVNEKKRIIDEVKCILLKEINVDIWFFVICCLFSNRKCKKYLVVKNYLFILYM